MTTRWLLVAGDFTPLGGMDRANHALASYLARQDVEVHLVTHRAWPDLAERANVRLYPVWRPFGRHLLGRPLLARRGRRAWSTLGSRGASVLVNGGNCIVPAANWVHYVHAAHRPGRSLSRIRAARTNWAHHRARAAERLALERASIVICNSARTKADVVDGMGIPAARVRVVYYGSDPAAFGPVDPAERAQSRQQLGLAIDRPIVGFMGALGDRRKAFDTLFEAWTALCARPSWDADLVVVGSGAELASWQQRASTRGLARRIRFLGFRRDVPQILAALDLLAHPARYDAYGLAVHEAICRGVPALVTASAGVAERYPAPLGDLLIEDPDDPDELVDRLSRWREDPSRFAVPTRRVGDSLRAYTWDAMAADIVAAVEQAA